MPKAFPLPEPWASRGWILKIQDRERNEDPHVTLRFKTKMWRIGLREFAFLDTQPDPGDVPKELVASMKVNLAEYIAAWDKLYPLNPVGSKE